MSTGEKIAKYRKELGLTQKQLGEKCGISQKQIGFYEQGRLNPKLETLKKIAKALNVSYYFLLEDESVYFGYRVQKYRELRNLSQKELSKLSKVSLSKIKRYEENIEEPNYEDICKIADALQIPITPFIDEEYDDSWIENEHDLDRMEQHDIAQKIMNKPISQIEREKIDEEQKNKEKLIDMLMNLNLDGQKKLIDQAELLSMIDEYKAKKDN